MCLKKSFLKFCVSGLLFFPLFAHAGGNVDEILVGLKSEDPFTRCKTMASIKITLELDQRIIAEVINSLTDSHEKVQAAARTTLIKMKGFVVPRLVKILNEANAFVSYEDESQRNALKMNVVGVLTEIGDVNAVPALIKSLQGYDDLKKASISCLGVFGPRAAAAVPALGKLIEGNGTPSEVYDLLRALIKIGPASVPELIRLIENRPWPGEYGEGKMNYPGMGKDLVVALGMIGAKAKSAVPILIPLLENEHDEIRQATVQALGEIGGSAKDSIPALKQALDDKNPDIRIAAAEALKKIGVVESKKMKEVSNDAKERKAAGF